ncbi:acyl-[acyl-carrier-protein]--UDP-N-acetylglucosamine O-acyltransferase [Hasllibacter halocynthiae]|uniref:Acyl-[acyl-carrier-protein]--UDP-N-acetylglucosamine O-acyltransferase n=1 Tax=Hasllibacter halocynthiae TaxID=595589 RepID=A0A2T0X842_9RHOB|nr:acyl-ACP--UDP-N-acetylglucosamine O-acyltransferase [Hasllibacter halocynthiae]PRY95097.1 acyl-[acyl-carrier-protein]--UDP-N-acetylglucosamine O-acyltransferase [Hasllibacter halocynthiae]
MIHPLAVVEEGASVGEGCEIGPFAVVGPQVVLGAGCVLRPHSVVTGDTELGEECQVFPGAVVGEVPQDLKYRGEPAILRIGARNVIREGATLNIGTEGGGGETVVGDRNLFMTGAHVGHDARIGSGCVVANQAAIAGHCVIEDDVVIGGLCGIHQFVRIGRGAIIGALAMVTNDVIPYGLVQGPRGELDGLNLVGMKRRGVERSDITALRAAYATLKQGEGSFAERARRLNDETDSAMVREVCAFVLSDSDRHFLVPK